MKLYILCRYKRYPQNWAQLKNVKNKLCFPYISTDGEAPYVRVRWR